VRSPPSTPRNLAVVYFHVVTLNYTAFIILISILLTAQQQHKESLFNNTSSANPFASLRFCLPTLALPARLVAAVVVVVVAFAKANEHLMVFGD